MYGIDRAPVDAEFEIEDRRRAGPEADRSDRCTALHPSALVDGDLGEISIERKRLSAVVDNHQSAVACGNPGMTGRLVVRYLKPTPLHRPVEIRGRTERVEGRRIVAKAEMYIDGVQTAAAEGLFLTIDPRLAATYFGVTETADPSTGPSTNPSPGPPTGTTDAPN